MVDAVAVVIVALVMAVIPTVVVAVLAWVAVVCGEAVVELERAGAVCLPTRNPEATPARASTVTTAMPAATRIDGRRLIPLPPPYPALATARADTENQRTEAHVATHASASTSVGRQPRAPPSLSFCL